MSSFASFFGFGSPAPAPAPAPKNGATAPRIGNNVGNAETGEHVRINVAPAKGGRRHQSRKQNRKQKQSRKQSRKQ